jgi:hypothetical protein
MTSSLNRFDDVKALGLVMKELMEMGTENRGLQLDRPFEWSNEAIEFLALTMTASPNELAKVSCKPGLNA